MDKVQAVAIGSAGIILIGVAVGEDLARRVVTKKFHQMVEARRQLELQVGEMVASHEQLKRDLSVAEQRSQELTAALGQARQQLEEAVGRLAQETRSGRELSTRLTTIQQQMEQMQSELAVALDDRRSASSASPAVQLERVVISDAQADALRGRIVSIHADWNFVVIDLGWDTVHIGDTVSILRNGQVMAKARVERVQEDVCAATILPEWKSDEIRVNDLVRIL